VTSRDPKGAAVGSADQTLPAELVARLTATGQTVATAESLTGGLVAARLTDVPGSSAVVRGGVVAYAIDVKAEVLGVDAELLADRGAVDAEVARQMAAGVRARLGSSYGLATTGVAGPGPAEGKPAGTVYVAVAGGQEVRARRLELSGDRAQIRARTVDAVLELLAEFL
jgi:nicotinamide-nucleotide amidase